MHVCHPNQQIFRHCLDKLAVQPSGMITQHHYNKYPIPKQLIAVKKVRVQVKQS